MAAITILQCDRCGDAAHFAMTGQYGAASHDDKGYLLPEYKAWKTIEAALLCPDCVKTVQDFIATGA